MILATFFPAPGLGQLKHKTVFVIIVHDSNVVLGPLVQAFEMLKTAKVNRNQRQRG